MTPLHLAAERARLKVIEYLVGKEADIINRQDQDGVNNIMCDCSNDKRLHGTYYFTTISRHMRKYIGITYKFCILSLPSSSEVFAHNAFNYQL